MTKVDLTEAQRLTESIEAAAIARFKIVNEEDEDAGYPLDWETGVGNSIKRSYREEARTVLEAAGLPALIGELTEARQQLETAQAQFDRSGELFRQQLVRTAQANVRGDEAEATIERVRALCDEAIAGTVIQPDGWALDPHAIRAALGAAVNDSSTEAKWRI